MVGAVTRKQAVDSISIWTLPTVECRVSSVLNAMNERRNYAIAPMQSCKAVSPNWYPILCMYMSWPYSATAQCGYTWSKLRHDVCKVENGALMNILNAYRSSSHSSPREGLRREFAYVHA